MGKLGSLQYKHVPTDQEFALLNQGLTVRALPFLQYGASCRKTSKKIRHF